MPGWESTFDAVMKNIEKAYMAQIDTKDFWKRAANSYNYIYKESFENHVKSFPIDCIEKEDGKLEPIMTTDDIELPYVAQVEKLVGDQFDPPDYDLVTSYQAEGLTPDEAAMKYIYNEQASRWSAMLFMRMVARVAFIGIILL